MGTLKIDQKGYIQDILEFKGKISCHPTVLLTKVDFTLFLDQSSDHQEVDLTIYECLIDELMYLSYRTRPDIAFTMRQLSRHNSDPCIEHLPIAKQVFWHLKGTITLGIEWENDLANQRIKEKYRVMGIIGYTNSS